MLCSRFVYSCPKQEQMPKDYPYSEYCCKKYSSIVQDELLDLQGKIVKWEKYEQKCQKHGIYEHYLAMMYVSHDNDKGISILTKSLLKTNFNIIENASSLGFIMYYKGYYKQLNRIANILINRYPEYCQGYYLLGIYYMTTGEWDLARANLEKAYKLKLPDSEVLIKAYLSTVYYEFGMYEDVIKLYCEAYRKQPKGTILQRRPTLTMIASLIHLGKLDDAQKLMSEWEKADNTLKNSEDYHKIKTLLEDALKQK